MSFKVLYLPQNFYTRKQIPGYTPNAKLYQATILNFAERHNFALKVLLSDCQIW